MFLESTSKVKAVWRGEKVTFLESAFGRFNCAREAPIEQLLKADKKIH